MNISARGRLDRESVRAQYYAQLFGKRKPKDFMIGYSVFLIAFFAYFTVSFFITDFKISYLKISLFFLGMYLLFLFMWFVIPKIQIASLKRMMVFEAENSYTFFDDSFQVETEAPERAGAVTLNYTYIKKLVETDKYLFIVQPDTTAFIVDKATVSESELPALTEKLKEHAEKHVRCKY